MWPLTKSKATWLCLFIGHPNHSLQFGFRERLKEHTNGCSLKTKGIAQAVLQVPLVGEMHRLCIIDKEHESGRIDLCLCRVVDLQYLVANHRRIMAAHSLLHDLVEA